MQHYFQFMTARKGYKVESSCPRQIVYEEVKTTKEAVTFAVDCFVRIACFCFYLFCLNINIFLYLYLYYKYIHGIHHDISFQNLKFPNIVSQTLHLLWIIIFYKFPTASKDTAPKTTVFSLRWITRPDTRVATLRSPFVYTTSDTDRALSSLPESSMWLSYK